MNRAKKYLALFLALMMCMSIMTGFASAAPSKPDYKVISIGDSTSNGYCLKDYGPYSGRTWSKHDAGLGFMDYASKMSTGYLMADYLTETLTDKNVVFESLTLEGMRTDELRALLDPSYVTDGLCDWFCDPDHIPTYEPRFDEYKAAGYDVGEATNIYEFYAQEVADADLIIMDCCTNNFGTYISDRFTIHSEQLNDNILDVPDGFVPGFKEMAEKAIDKYFASLKDVLPDGMVKNLVDAITYALADMCANFSFDVAKILELNPDVKLICVGPFNIMQGLTATYDGIDIDFGNLWGILINLANTYITSFDPNNNRFYFADVMSGVDMIIKDVAEGNFTPQYIGDIIDAFGQSDDQKKLLNQANKALATYPEGSDEYKTAYAAIYEGDFGNVLKLVSEAAGYSDLELTDVLDMLLGDGDLKKTASNVAIKGLQDWNSLSPGEKSLMHLFFRFFINGSGTHPSESGYQTKVEAVKKAYNSTIPASGSADDVAIDTGLHTAVGILNTLRAPIVDALGKIFSFIDLSAFFNAIFEQISQFLLKLIPLR